MCYQRREPVHCCWDTYRVQYYVFHYSVSWVVSPFFVRAGEFRCLYVMNLDSFESTCGMSSGGIIFKCISLVESVLSMGWQFITLMSKQPRLDMSLCILVTVVIRILSKGFLSADSSRSTEWYHAYCTCALIYLLCCKPSVAFFYCNTAM